jgi:hypothetical protein
LLNLLTDNPFSRPGKIEADRADKGKNLSD